jgi:hypothetical protein
MNLYFKFPNIHMREKGLVCMITMVLNGNKKINVWFWLIMFNIRHIFWLLIMCFDLFVPKIYISQNTQKMIEMIFSIYEICSMY